MMDHSWFSVSKTFGLGVRLAVCLTFRSSSGPLCRHSTRYYNATFLHCFVGAKVCICGVVGICVAVQSHTEPPSLPICYANHAGDILPTNCLSGSNRPHCPNDETHGPLSARKPHHRSGDVYHCCKTKDCGYGIWLAPQNQEAAKESGKRNTTPAPVNVHIHVQAAQTPDPMQTLQLLQGLQDFVDNQHHKQPRAKRREPREPRVAWWEKLYARRAPHEQGKGGHYHGPPSSPPPPPFSLSQAQPPPAYGARPLSQRDGSATGLPRSAPSSFRAPGPTQPQPPLASKAHRKAQPQTSVVNASMRGSSVPASAARPHLASGVEPLSAPEAKKRKFVSLEEVERLSSEYRSTQGRKKKRSKKVTKCYQDKGSTQKDALHICSSSNDEITAVE